MKRILFGLLLALILPFSAANAQSTCPTIQTGAVLTAGQWNACFSAKQNSLGFAPLNKAGDVMSGKLTTLGTTTLSAGLNLPHGTAPITPANGDMWSTTAGIFARVNGATVGPFVSTGSAPVSSVFGRSGAVVAVTNDYSFAQISGSVAATQLPNPSATTLGGVKSLAAVSNQFLTSIGTNGTPTQAQPSAANLSNGTTGSGSVVLNSAPALTTPTINDPVIGGFIVRPQGRLTLTSGVPVLTANATAQSSVFYTPYQGNNVPIYDGTRFIDKTFTEITQVLATSGTNFQASGSLYDLFVINDAGTLRLCNGPAWSSTTARGTGAGTTELQQLTGIWTNKNSIAACRFGSVSGNTVAVSANQGTYVGTLYATANGQTGMNFTPAAAAGGSNTILGLYNAYNRVPVRGFSQDSTASWTYATTTWRSANASTSNRISWVDGLQQSSIDSHYIIMTSAVSATSNTGISIDGTSAPTGAFVIGTNNSSSTIDIVARVNSLPLLGFHFAQAVEISGATSTYFGGTGGALFLNADM